MAATIRSVPGFTLYGISDEGEAFGQRGQRLKPFQLKAGYLRFSPSVAGKLHHMLVHRAVALAFIGDPPDDERIFVGHRNGIPYDNWLTESSMGDLRGELGRPEAARQRRAGRSKRTGQDDAREGR